MFIYIYVYVYLSAVSYEFLKQGACFHSWQYVASYITSKMNHNGDSQDRCTCAACPTHIGSTRCIYWGLLQNPVRCNSPGLAEQKLARPVLVVG
jgi:hypothetical protein